MKLLLTILFLFISQQAWAGSPFGSAYGSFLVGIEDSGTATSTTLDTAFVNTSAGDFVGVRFNSPVSQSSATLKLHSYCTGATGSPTNAEVQLFAGPSGAMDDDRPDTGSPLATSANVDMSSCSTAGWKTATLTADLTEGATYFIGWVNTTATPGSNNFAIQHRGALEGYIGNIQNLVWMSSLVSTDGFTTDPATSVGPAMVLEFANGDTVGVPFVAQAAHASNTNWRGNRFTPPEDWTVRCFKHAALTVNTATLRIYQGSTIIKSVTPDRFQANNGNAACFEAITLTGGVAYDVVLNTSVNSTIGTIYSMGTSPPAEIQTISPNITYVDGATPGSLSETTTSLTLVTLMLQTNPAISGGGTDLLGVIQ